MDIGMEENGAGNLFTDALKNEQQFELLIQWMCREFSSENALCLIELVQFKQFVLGHMQSTETLGDGVRYIDLFYKSVPKSSIIHEHKSDSNGIEMFKEIAHLLHDKYIRVNSELQVNISSQLRRRYMILDVKKWEMEMVELLNIFDKVMDEMYFFMRQSFMRYQHVLNRSLSN